MNSNHGLTIVENILALSLKNTINMQYIDCLTKRYLLTDYIETFVRKCGLQSKDLGDDDTTGSNHDWDVFTRFLE